MPLTHLGPYSDLIEAARQSRLQPRPQNELLRHLAFSPWKPAAREPRVEKKWSAESILAEEISWSCGYGPRTHAWLFHAEKYASTPRPALVLLHDHGAFKFWGKEKVADGAEGLAPGFAGFRRRFYGDRALAAELARAGFTVLVHDVFLWGSRRVPYETMPEGDRKMGQLLFQEQCRTEDESWQSLPEEVRIYNAAANFHEHTMAKYATVLGATLSGIVNFEDLVAVDYLKSRADLCNGWIGCIGLSGGGLRSALLRGACETINAAVIVGLMSSYAGLLDRHVCMHTWLLFPPSLTQNGDWPDVVAREFQVPVLVQYNANDELFTPEGMAEADAHLRAAFSQSKFPGHYRAEFYPGPHKFDAIMQDAAIAWLQAQSQPRD